MASFNTTKRTGSSSSKYIYCICNYSTSDTNTYRTISVSSLQLYRTVGWKDSFTYSYYTSGTLQTGDSHISNSASVKDKQYAGSGTTTVVGAQAKNFKRTKSAYTLTLNAYFYTHSTYYRGSVNITIPARASHTISYNANGGTGTIGNQTKYYSDSGETAYYETLSDGTGFTRNGYKLVGWNTAIDGSGTAYSLGEIYTVNGTTAVTLYAQWKQEILIKNNGSWTGYVDAEYLKVAGNWVSVNSKYIKINGAWIES